MSLFDNSLAMRTLDMLERGMDAQTLRRQVIADNIANVDVPHFKRSEVIFEAAMKRAVDEERALAEPRLEMRTSSPNHIQRPASRGFEQAAPHRVVDYGSSMRNDGNNVDIENEVAELTRNQLHYSLLVDRFGGTYRQLNQLLRMA